MTSKPKPDWVDKVVATLPERMSEDEVAATMLMLVSCYVEDPREAGPLLMSLPLTYWRANGLSLSVLKQAYEAAAYGVEEIMRREAREPRH